MSSVECVVFSVRFISTGAWAVWAHAPWAGRGRSAARWRGARCHVGDADGGVVRGWTVVSRRAERNLKMKFSDVRDLTQ
eukprot:387671-Prymnesium_polylepis.2